MKYLTAFAAAFLLAALGASAMPYVKVLGVTPDLVLIFAACWAMVRGQGEAMWVVPMAGLLRDLSSSDPLGTSVLALSPIVLLAAAREVRPVDTEFVPALVVVAAGSLAYGLLSMAVLAAAGQTVPWPAGLLRVVLPSVLVNALFTPIVYLPLRWLSPSPRPGTARLGQATPL
ncbi:MAG: rod shape-determining protein MreD [Chloroflexi bacterium]|nr:rod shape-determining protein MreD [Chloroflexota bacterium]